MSKKRLIKLFLIFFAFGLLLTFFGFKTRVNSFFDFSVKTVEASSAEETEEDAELYEKYNKYLKYKKYSKYKKAKEKYGFESSAQRLDYKQKYKLYKDNPKKYAAYYEQYKRYKKYKSNYKEKYGKYGKYKKYYAKKSIYQKYNKSKYKNAYERYKKVLANKGSSSSLSSSGSLGPEISVGILSYDKSYSKDHSFRFKANKNYCLKNKDNNQLTCVDKDTETKVNYAGDGNLRVYGSGFDFTISTTLNLEAEDGNNGDMIFNVEPKTFDDYRGKIRVRYSDDSDQVWVINILPLEQYAWGMGEITGTGDMDYNRVMSVTYRTYGYWKIEYSTRYENEGFKVDATSSSQVYYGYDWETDHPRIREAVEDTRGKIVKYGSRIAITPYSSSTDGKTRSWKDVWGSSNYPWCKSVDDPYGKVANAADIPGNHMVGLSARGAVNLAGDHGWDWDKILKYYYTGIDIAQVY